MKKTLFLLLCLAAAWATSPGNATPAITATKSAALLTDGNNNGKADPGDTIEYTVVIQNNGPGSGTGVSLSDALDPNTTLLNVLPIARNDSYSAVGNTLLEVGVPASGNPAVKVAGNVLQNDLDFMDPLTVTSPAGSFTTGNGGTVAMSANGTFSYLPAVNFTGTDSFSYTIQDSQGATSSATVTINVQNKVWYVNSAFSGSSDGRSTSPFTDLAPVNGAGDADGPGDVIYVFSGSYSGPFTLEQNEKLVGNGVALVVGGHTLRPAGTAPTIHNGAGNSVSLANGNSIAGVTLTANGGKAIVGTNVTGLSIESASIAALGPGQDDILIVNSTAALNMTLTSSSIGPAGGPLANSGLNVQTLGTGGATVNVANSVINNHSTDGLLFTFNGSGAHAVTVNGSAFTNNDNAIDIASDFDADVTVAITGNTLIGQQNTAISVVTGTSSTGASSVGGVISGNIIGNADPDSGSVSGTGIALDFRANAVVALTIHNNTIQHTENGGIAIENRLGTAGSASLRITDNTVGAPDDNSPFPLGSTIGIRVTSRNNHAVCLNLSGNNSAGSGAGFGYQLRQANTAVFQLHGFAGTGTSAAAVESFITSQNTGSANVQTSGAGTIVNYTSGSCTTPAPLLAGLSSAKPADSTAANLPEGNVASVTASRAQHSLSNGDLCAIVEAALLRWTAAGLTTEQIGVLNSIRFCVSDLPGSYLAESSSGLVKVDSDAGGHGWFVDPSPLDDREFSFGAFSTGLPALSNETSARGIDLLTTVMHEMGHALGVSDSYLAGNRGSIMYGLLTKGVRRLPTVGQAEGAIAGSIEGTHFQATTVNLAIGTLAAGESITIKIRVAINDPLPGGVCQISNQGTVSGNEFANVLTDDPGTAAANDATVTTVDGTAPVITACAPSQSAAANANCQAAVPDFTGTVTAADNCTAAGALVITQSPAAGSLVGVGETPVTITVKDGANNSATCMTAFTVTDNLAPTINCSGIPTQIVDAAFNCGATLPDVRELVRAQSTDNCTATTALVVSQSPAPGTAAPTNGSYQITVTVKDASNNSADCVVNVSVINVNPPPSAVAISAPASGAIFAVGTPVNFAGSFTDNAGDTHTAVWTFASHVQNLTQSGTVNEGAGTVSATHTFTQAGVFLVTLTVTDSCGGSATANTVGGLTAMVVIYDPNAGYVTGGGWITSPAGAYVAAPGLSGQASFGFISKYQQGANVPDGNTQFHFQAANFRFSSTSYDWLVIAGARAQYKGTGTVNGSGNYGFLLTAIDGQVNGGGGVDKLRLKVWDKDNGNAVVYDNNIGANDNANPTTALGGGQIVIHP